MTPLEELIGLVGHVRDQVEQHKGQVVLVTNYVDSMAELAERAGGKTSIVSALQEIDEKAGELITLLNQSSGKCVELLGTMGVFAGS